MIDYINRRSKGVDNGFGIYQTYSQGFLFGKCSSVNCTIYHPLLYGSTKDNLMFHPDDHMNMLCYESRK